MKINLTMIQRFGLALVLGALLPAGSGCATSGRRVLLKEYGPSVPKNEQSPLKGMAIAIKPFTSQFNINDKVEQHRPAGGPIEPAGYTYKELTGEEAKQWDRDVAERKKVSKESEWPEIGYVRNGFGMIMSKVYALNDSCAWLADTLKRDLEEQGARIVDPDSADAIVSVGGVLRYLKIDIYMKYWADLIVDVRMSWKDKPPVQRTIHTTGGQMAWSSSNFEYFQTIRQCQQKFSRAVIQELEQAAK